MPARIFRFALGLGLVARLFAFGPSLASAQQPHDHTPAVSGLPQGVPYFCANPSVTSRASGLWSDSRTWSAGKVPGATDKVKIAAGYDVTYNVVSDATLDCVEVEGHLRFETRANTRLKVANLMIMDQGRLEVGTQTERK